jgi:uncharacterized protein (TIGR02391 family)
VNDLWSLTADEMTAMPTDALGLLVLRDYVDAKQWNEGNWLGLAAEKVGHDDRRLKRLADAWAWIRSEALVSRTPNQSTPDAVTVSQLGLEALVNGLGKLRAMRRLPGQLHPALGWQVRRQFLIGEYDLGVLAAFRMVETSVRTAGEFADVDVGVSLMNRAFNKDHGVLRDPSLSDAEQEAMRALFAGSIGLFRNPVAHREVNYDDPTLAAELVCLADLLLRILDGVIGQPNLARDNPA